MYVTAGGREQLVAAVFFCGGIHISNTLSMWVTMVNIQVDQPAINVAGVDHAPVGIHIAVVLVPPVTEFTYPGQLCVYNCTVAISPMAMGVAGYDAGHATA
ncbi:unnamed protein product [Sphagnum balticum]